MAKFTQSFLASLKGDGQKHWYWDSELSGFALYQGPSGGLTWYVNYRRSDGKKAFYKIGAASVLTVAQAREAAKMFLAKLTLGEEPDPPRKKQSQTLGEFLKNYYIPWLVDSSRSVRSIRWTLAVLERDFGFLKQISIKDITRLKLEQWQAAQRKEQGVKAATINRKFTVLRAVLNWGVKHDLIPANPIAHLSPLREDDSECKVRYLSSEERERLVAALDAREARMRQERDNHNVWLVERGHAPLPDLKNVAFADYFKPVVLLALNTGIRRNALFSLLWGDIDLDRRLIVLRAATAKSRRAGFVNFNRTAFVVLTKWRGQSDDTGADSLVFQSPKGGGVMKDCRSAWEKVLKEANIKNFRWHDMRHDFASRLVMAGVDLNTVRELLGHASLTMTLRYAHGVKLYLPVQFCQCGMFLKLCKYLPNVPRLAVLRYVLRIYADAVYKRNVRLSGVRSLPVWYGDTFNAATLEAIAEWHGVPGALVATLDKSGFIYSRPDAPSGVVYRVRNVPLVAGN